jgi:hypothetical protein
MTQATLTLTAEEQEKLLRSGYVEFNDPERGHMKIWLLFDELSPGVTGKQIRLKVLRAGSAAVSEDSNFFSSLPYVLPDRSRPLKKSYQGKY